MAKSHEKWLAIIAAMKATIEHAEALVTSTEKPGPLRTTFRPVELHDSTKAEPHMHVIEEFEIEPGRWFFGH